MYHFIRAFAVFAADRISAVVLTDFSREAAKTRRLINYHLNFAASRETVFCANLQRVQEKYN